MTLYRNVTPPWVDVVPQHWWEQLPYLTARLLVICVYSEDYDRTVGAVHVPSAGSNSCSNISSSSSSSFGAQNAEEEEEEEEVDTKEKARGSGGASHRHHQENSDVDTASESYKRCSDDDDSDDDDDDASLLTSRQRDFTIDGDDIGDDGAVEGRFDLEHRLKVIRTRRLVASIQIPVHDDDDD